MNIKNIFKDYAAIMIIFFIISLVVVILPWVYYLNLPIDYMQYPELNNQGITAIFETTPVYNDYLEAIVYSNIGVYISGNLRTIFYVIISITVVIMTLIKLNFLHNKIKSDFYLKLPIKRTTIIRNNIVGSYLAFIIPFIISLLIGVLYIYIATSDYSVPIITTDFLVATIQNIIYISIFYILVLLTVSLGVVYTATPTEAIITTLTVGTFIPGIYITFYTLIQLFYDYTNIYIFSTDPNNLLLALSPFTSITLLLNSEIDLTLFTTLFYIIINIGFIVILYILNQKIFKTRKAEIIETTTPKKKLVVISKIYVSYFIAFIICLVLQNIFGMNIILAIIFAIITAIILEIVISRGITEIKNSIKIGVVTAISFSLILIVTQASGGKIIKAIPPQNMVQSVSLSYNSYNDYFIYGNDYYITNQHSNTYTVSTSVNADSYYGSVSYNERDKAYNNLVTYTSEEMIEKTYNIHQNISDYGNHSYYTDIYKVSYNTPLWNSSKIYNNYSSLLEYEVTNEFIMKNNPVFMYDTSKITYNGIRNEYMNPVFISEADNFNTVQLIESIKADVKNTTIDELKGHVDIIGYIHFEINIDEKSRISYFAPVLKSYNETIRELKNQNLYEAMIEDEEFDTVYINKYPSSEKYQFPLYPGNMAFDNYQDYLKVTDESTIEYYKENSSPLYLHYKESTEIKVAFFYNDEKLVGYKFIEEENLHNK